MVAVADLTVGQGVAAALPNFTSEHSSLELRRSWQPCWRRVKEEDFFFLRRVKEKIGGGSPATKRYGPSGLVVY
jgi:hypothetical protein